MRLPKLSNIIKSSINSSSNNTKGNGHHNNNGKKKGYKFFFAVSIKDLVLYTIAFFLIMGVVGSLLPSDSSNTKSKPMSEIFSDLKEGRVEKVTVDDESVKIKYKDGTNATSVKDPRQDFSQMLFSKDGLGLDPKQITLVNTDNSLKNQWVNILSNLLPTLIFIGIFVWMMRQAKGAQDSIFSFGSSRGKLFNQDNPKVTFKDVAGVDEAKKELEEVVDFLKNPKKYASVGARTPKGVLLVGPSGTGKTLLAKAVAGEAGVPFFSMAGSEFMEMLVGVGASRARDLFATAKKNKPAIIFIDEIDAIGRARSMGLVGGHDEREQTLNQILIEMDGFEPNEQVVVMAATNRGDLLDSALLRPGRFDRRVMLDLPDKDGRLAILSVHKKNKPFEDAVDWEKVAKRTVGFSGADLENMLNEAAILAARQDRNKINMPDLEEAATKVKMGPQKKRLQTDLDKKITAYHEAGHAIVTHFLPNMDPVHRISIVSRGMSLGHTLIPPAADRLHETKSHLVEQIASMLGGRAAEDLVFKEITTGASSDIQQVTSIARDMVVEYGMSVLGPINWGSEAQSYMGRMYTEAQKLSEETTSKIDQEIRRIVDEGMKVAVAILKKHREELDKVAEGLLLKENMDGDEFETIVGIPKIKL